ncbi:neurofilament heavy polypeptide isoform X1 [Ceratitis capitata]|uniref:neurofilament heavy polypeptide isoform X1 n=2 Tax=Ceratitis capitata TaxID=7213 RepID=UPI0003298EF4|nr:neurofilament heavy polypeptide isoform X1 [Ceratitis capitata]
MAMLAEPRQRKRYNLTPRGKPLYEDDSRFGTKMLEKMGWSKGKGLGAKENGIQDFVRVRMRNTNEGLGFEDRDDHWTQHEQDFTGLLKTLNGKSDENEKDNNEASDEDAPRVGFGFPAVLKKPKVEKLKDSISGISLEEKSKLSKARVHYRKFTKGKDIAQYSEKDLANIFGKKAVDTPEADGIYSQLTAITTKEEEKEEDETIDVDDKEVKSNFGGVQTISTGLSVSDYFKQKMEAIKNKQKQKSSAPHSDENDTTLIVNVQVDQIEGGKKKKNKKRKRETEAVEADSPIDASNRNKTDVIDLENDNSLNNDVEEPVAAITVTKNDKKKKKKRVLEIVDLTTQEENNVHTEVPKKKKKKSKEYSEEQPECNTDLIHESEQVEIQAVEEIQEKRKTKKSKPEQSHELDVEVNTDVEIPKVKPPKTKKDKTLKEVVPTMPTDHNTDETVVKKNKKSKNKGKLEDETQQVDSQTNAEAASIQSSKKSKKEKKHEKPAQANTAEEIASNEQTEKKKSKSKKDVSDEIKMMTLDELIAKCNSYNVYTISSFCAEKFRNIALDSFKGSTIAHLPGYSHTSNLQLNVINEPRDEERITKLWNCSLDKYRRVNPKVIFNKYRKNLFKAYKAKNKKNQKAKLPQFNIKSLKRKNVFQPI